ncbi:MAG: hypothetical protein MZV65_42110 [Chromatiales bacterium]|nr:hypothetical protein [Chromatiales bacterium]
MKYLDETQQTDYRLNMPITIEEDNSLSGLGILEVRKLVEGVDTTASECVAGETNGIRAAGEVMVIGELEMGTSWCKSLGADRWTRKLLVYLYCVNTDDVERNVKVFNLKLDTPAGQAFSNYIIDALYIFSEGMLQNPMDPVDDFSNHNDHGFSLYYIKVNCQNRKMILTPNVAAE